MCKLKILVVSATFYPLNSPRANRTTELVKELAGQGHDVTVLTPKENEYHIPFEEKHRVTIKHLGNRKWKGFSIKGKGLMRLFDRARIRIFMLLFEYPDIELMGMVKKMLKKENGYDLLISIAVPFPVHWGVAAVRSKSHPIAKVWAADCGDPFMGDKADSFKKLFYFKYIEQWFCGKTDYITVPTVGSVDAYYPEFRDKIKIIPQGFNFDDIKIFRGIVKNEVPTFGYAGGFIPGVRDPRALLDFLCQYEHSFKFIIYTNKTDLVLPYIAASKNRIELKAYISREQLLLELSKMDFLLNINNGTTVQTPSKLIDYVLTGRPVLSIDKGTLDTIIIEQFLRGDYTNQFIIGDIEQYNIKNVARQFVALSEK